MSTELAVCYVADQNFLFGALASVRSFRGFVPASKAEVFVFYLNPDSAVMERVRRSMAKYAATILPLQIDDRFDFSAKTWNKTHVPHSALGRFYIEPHLPSHIHRILYIDGDTLFVRDPIDLIGFVPSENTLAAAEDISFFARNDWGKFGGEMRGYFAGLGIDGSRGYLNSGLLLACRGAWRSIVAEAQRFFDNHSDRCLYHDQSALNAIVGARRVRLSPRWNFQTPFCYWRLREEARPSILHFTEFPKPWMGNISPWSFVEDTIKQATREFSDLELPMQRLSAAEVEMYNRLKQDRAWRLATRMPMRLLSRRREFRRLMESSAL